MVEPVDTTPKATAIFWVDKDKDYQVNSIIFHQHRFSKMPIRFILKSRLHISAAIMVRYMLLKQ